MSTWAHKLAQLLLPERLHEVLHLVRHRQDYLVLPKADLTFAEDGLYSQHAAPFLGNERFDRAYRLGAETNSWHGNSIRWRAFVACWAGEHAAQVEGDFVECGVNRGGLARCMVDYLCFERIAKRFYLVDTYQGLVREHLTEEERRGELMTQYDYYRDNSREVVEEIFRPFPNVQVIQGAVPEILPAIPTQKVAFLSLDMNCVMPELRAAEYFWECMSPGGILLHDDYGFKMHAAQRRMLDKFARTRGVGVLALPTGQGIIIKPGVTLAPSASLSIETP